MHSYSTSRSRVAIYGAIAVPAVILAWLIVTITSSLDWPQWLVSAPSVVATYGAVYALVDRVLWKHPLFQKTGLSDVVDISGIYEGKLTSTYTDQEGRPVVREVVFTIIQTWTHISIAMTVEGGSSSSVSDSAIASVTKAGDGTRLAYIYQNRVNPGLADPDMGDHAGAADITVREHGDLTGRYYNSRPRAGTIEASRV